MTLQEIKSRWNEVLDEVLRQDRILWLAIFDARLAGFSDGVLTLDFIDSGKFAAEHDFSYIRNQERVVKISTIAESIIGIPIAIKISE